MNAEKPTISTFERIKLLLVFLFYALFAWHQWWSGVSPRLIRGSPERDAIHHAHLNNGALLFVLFIILALIWLLRPGSTLVARLRHAFSNAGTTGVSLFFMGTFGAMLFGLAQAWAAGGETALFGLYNLPHFLDWSWGTSGYLHSSFSNISSALFAGVIFVYLYTKLRPHVHPALAVVILLGVHVLVNLPKPPSLHPIALIGTYVMVPTYYLVGLALYNFAHTKRWIYWPVYLLFTLFFLYLPYFAFKVLPPWHAPAAAEIVQVESSTPLSPSRSKTEIFADAQALSDAKETASWCGQCHNLKATGAHLLGPNLVGVFNTQAGTVNGYGRNSSAMLAAGSQGTYWTRENLANFLTDGQSFIPENLMNQQTDLSDPARLKQVIDYVEYLSSK